MAMRLLMRSDYQQLEQNLSMLRSEYLFRLPEIQSLDARVTPELVLALLVNMDSRRR